MKFYVTRIKVAKKMMELGSVCKGCHLDKQGYVIYEFERNQQTLDNYAIAKLVK